ncbi:MAG: phage integrase SAM-like domain-containing protein, partial [Flavobacteriales bacterium]
MAVKLRERKLKDGAKSYYLDCSLNGERWTETITGKHTKGGKKNKELKFLAETTRANREIELSSRGTKYIPNHKKKIFLSTYFESYIESYAKKDIRMLKSSYSWFNKFINEPNNKTSNKLFELTKKDCNDFKDYLTSSHLTGETPHNLLARFKKIIKQAIADGYLYDNPTDGITIKRQNKLKKEILTADELKILKNTHCGNDEVKRAFLFAAFTGLGLSECQKLQWKHIKNNKVKILRSKLADKDI